MRKELAKNRDRWLLATVGTVFFSWALWRWVNKKGGKP